ncbi:hypothetical protein F385_3513 [Pantoea agglomerans 299R]|nr:hypothetical protein F385_3513 [Pantoea agglomerans 299R]
MGCKRNAARKRDGQFSFTSPLKTLSVICGSESICASGKTGSVPAERKQKVKRQDG